MDPSRNALAPTTLAAAVVVLAIVVSTAGCGNVAGLGLSSSGSSTSGGAMSGVVTTSPGADALDASTGCLSNATLGVTLCATLAICPGVVVDRDRFPDCGFRPRTDEIDLLCVCDVTLCPMALALTCDQARQTLDDQTELGVCAQVAGSVCTPAATTGGTAGASAGSSCDRACLADCGGSPDCVQLCGC